MKKSTNYILTIGGFDPCGGAGILADIKTFEQHKCIGMAVQTANTIQTENQFISVNWIDEVSVIDQLQTLLNAYQFNVVKIGLIPGTGCLERVLNLCLTANPKTKIVWDPVLSATAGFDFAQDLSQLKTCLSKLYLITPNWDEAKQLSGNDNAMAGAKLLAGMTHVLLKGGHSSEHTGKDFLLKDDQIKPYNPKTITFYPKHGSGCVLSSSLSANLNLGYPLHKSVLRSKRYIESFLSSHPSLIGKHRL